MDSQAMNKCCQQMRLDLLELAHNAGSQGAHIASGLSEIEILAAVYLNKMNLEKDHFILSKGHGGLGYYTALKQADLITRDQLLSFETDGGDFPGQPSKNLSIGIEYSSGTLGVGISYSAGIALAKKLSNGKGNVYVLLGDGECDEGSVWETAMFANAQHLDNLIAIVDYNKMQSDGTVKSVLQYDPENIWKSFGWATISVDGHNTDKLLSALNMPHCDQPLVIIANTIKGKGVSFMENNNAWHHNRLSDEDYEKAVQEIKEVL